MRTKQCFLRYIKIRLTPFIIYKHDTFNKEVPLVNVIVGCFQVYGKASRGL